ncbi:MAG: SDR family NAD(P)-dependent oxidoreductase [Actinomycetota bacterium]|nr:SDR family NAD(P)-dependent oxidoreductase [Actinomycetota bacterium]
MTTDNATVLITGAARGLGVETTRRLASRGWTVWMGVRDTTTGAEVADKIRADFPDADLRVVELDVTSDESVSAAYDVVAGSGSGLDVLVNNAGVTGRFVDPADTVPADFLPVFGVNLLGPVRVTHAFLPLLRTSSFPRLVMVSSGMGSFGVTTDPDRFESTLHGLAYPSSKSALNMVTSMYAKSLTDVRVTAVDPGYTATELNGFSGTQTVTEGTDAIVEACTAEAVPATFFDRSGPVPW